AMNRGKGDKAPPPAPAGGAPGGAAPDAAKPSPTSLSHILDSLADGAAKPDAKPARDPRLNPVPADVADQVRHLDHENLTDILNQIEEAKRHTAEVARLSAANDKDTSPLTDLTKEDIDLAAPQPATTPEGSAVPAPEPAQHSHRRPAPSTRAAAPPVPST